MPHYQRQGFGRMLIEFSTSLCYLHSYLGLPAHFPLLVAFSISISREIRSLMLIAWGKFTEYTINNLQNNLFLLNPVLEGRLDSAMHLVDALRKLIVGHADANDEIAPTFTSNVWIALNTILLLGTSSKRRFLSLCMIFFKYSYYGTISIQMYAWLTTKEH